MSSKADTPKYGLRAVTSADSDFICGVRSQGLRNYVVQVWGWDETVQSARFRESFDPKKYQVVVVDGQDIGALSVEWNERDAFIADIEVLPEWRGRGLGTAILRTILVQARTSGRSVSLQVMKVNPARRLYERLGFHIYGETETHYLMRAPSQ